MKHEPDARGHFGPYGGRYTAETLMPALIELEQAYRKAMKDPVFNKLFHAILRDYVGRPSPLYLAERLTKPMAARAFTSSARIWTIPAPTK